MSWAVAAMPFFCSIYFSFSGNHRCAEAKDASIVPGASSVFQTPADAGEVNLSAATNSVVVKIACA